MNGQLAAVLSSHDRHRRGCRRVLSWIIGFVDMFRLPGWAWHRAKEKRGLWVVLLSCSDRSP